MKTKLKILIVSISFLTIVAFTSPIDDYFDIAKSLEVFTSLFKEIDAYYVDEINPEKLINKGIIGMLESLDQYSEFIPEEEAQNNQNRNSNISSGIGVQLAFNNTTPVVKRIYEGSPANLVGIKIGDEINSINGRLVKGKSSNEVERWLKGKVNTSVIIKVIRDGNELVFNTIIGELKPLSSVEKFMITTDIGYIQLNNFNDGAYQEVRQAINIFSKQNVKYLILDLRENSNGLLNEALNIANLFLPIGTKVVSTRSKVLEWEETYSTLHDAWDTNIPLVVITNGGSSSVSEIVAGALQDNDRALLLGQKSGGNGLVQTTKNLVYGSQIKLSVAEYIIPSGRSIQSKDAEKKRTEIPIEKLHDSINPTYYTKNGRKVFSANGLIPDIQIESGSLNSYVDELTKSGLIYEYATKYCSDNSAPEDLLEFKIPVKQYHEFEIWLQHKQFTFTPQLEKKADEFLELTDKESSTIINILHKLKTQISQNSKKVVSKYQNLILPLLEKEIISQYVRKNPKIEFQVYQDIEIREAIKVLENDSLYKKMLMPN